MLLAHTGRHQATASPDRCAGDVPQDYLVCVTVHKASFVGRPNDDTFIAVHCADGRNSRRTATFHCSETPYFNEYFVFEMHQRLDCLLRQSVRVALFRKTCCAKRDECFGEVLIELHTIWAMENQSFYKKWVETSAGNYVQIDMSIITKGSRPTPALLVVKDYDIIEENMLIPPLQSKMRPTTRNVTYCLNVFSGFFTSKRDYSVAISFAGATANTCTKPKTQFPEWNEKLIFPSTFPSLCQSFRVEVGYTECGSTRTLSSAEVHFDEMLFVSNDGVAAQTPSYGPGFLQLYGVNALETYVGRLLLSLRTEEGGETTNLQPVVMNIPPIITSECWKMESFSVHCTLFETSFASNVRYTKLRTRLRWAEQCSREVVHLLRTPAKPGQRPTTVVPSRFETMQVSLEVPDVRFKHEVDNALMHICTEMQEQLILSTQLLHTSTSNQEYLKQIVTRFIDKLTIFGEHNSAIVCNKYTEWDENRRTYLQKLIVQSLDTLKTQLSHLNRKSFDATAETSVIQLALEETLSNLLQFTNNNPQNQWPELLVEIYASNDAKIVATMRCDPRKYLLASSEQRASGSLCNVKHSAVFKPVNCRHLCLNCGCHFAVAEMQMQVGIASQEMLAEIPPAESSFRVNVYVHQAKLHADASADVSGSLRMDAILGGSGQVASTRLMATNSTGPVWNETVSFRGQIVHAHKKPAEKWSLVNVPLLVLEMTWSNTRTKSPDVVCIGRAFYLPLLRDEYGENDVVDAADKHDSRMDYNFREFLPTLRWVHLMRDGKVVAEVLMSAECKLAPQLEPSPPKVVSQHSAPLQEHVNQIPAEICPIIAKFKVDVTFVGIRNWHNHTARTLGRFKVVLSFGDLWLTSGPSSKAYGDSVNLLDPFQSGYVDLPEEVAYWPTVFIKHMDCSSKNETIIGTASVTQAGKYLANDACNIYGSRMCILGIEQELSEQLPLLNTNIRSMLKFNTSKNSSRLSRVSKLLKAKIKSTIRRPSSITSIQLTPSRHILSSSFGFTWWTKYYNSIPHSGEYDRSQKHRLRIFLAELENEPDFAGLRDWADCVDLLKVVEKPTRKTEPRKSYAQMKLDIKVRRCSDSNKCYSLNKAQQLLDLISERTILIQIYIVQGINLRPRDRVQSSDTYIQIECGATKISDRQHYITNQSNPIFGKRYQCTAILPKDCRLKISVFDHDMSGLCDDLIGATIIDLEDRLRSRHRAHSGVANEYNRLGYNIWRGPQTPSQVLRQVCEKAGLDPPIQASDKLQVGGALFADSTLLSLDEPLIERLSLSVLKELHTIPSIGYKLVPEHVETRSLFRDDRPGLEQGKLQLWLEINDPQRPPDLIDITPSPPHKYELRVIVWNTRDVILDEANIFGKLMSDIYVKGWLENADEPQSTDVHYRSLTGEGNFNWRMVFPLLYAEAEDMMVVVKRKRFYEQFDTQLKRPAILNMQIWDNDAISSDDFLGATTIHISSFAMPPHLSGDCRLPEKRRRPSGKQTAMVNLFERQHSVRGWFPVKGQLKNGKIAQTGKIELELEVVLGESATAVGLGQDGPFALPPPNRPDTSFKWYASPMKSVQHIFAPGWRKIFIWLAIAAICFVLLLLLFEILKGGAHNILSKRNASKKCAGIVKC